MAKKWGGQNLCGLYVCYGPAVYRMLIFSAMSKRLYGSTL